MSDLRPIAKIALYGAPDRVTDALQDVLLERGLQVVVIVDDPTDIAARPGLAAKSGTPFNADSVARSVAGTDAVIAVLTSHGPLFSTLPPAPPKRTTSVVMARKPNSASEKAKTQVTGRRRW